MSVTPTARTGRITVAAAAGALTLAVTAAMTGVASASPSSSTLTTKTPSTTVKLGDRSVSGLPSIITAGWHSFTVTQAAKDGREFSVGLLKPGVTVEEITKLDAASGNAVAPLITLFKSVSINGGVDTTKSYRASTRTYVTNLTPGNWVVADTASDNGPSYFKGFTVVAGSVGSKPKTSAAVGVSDFKFALSNLKAGSQSVVFHNSGHQTHEISIERIDPGHTQADVLKALAGQNQPSWLHDDGYYGLLSPGQSMFGKLTFAPGTNYLFLCFLPDYNKPKSYTPHVEEGMFKFFSTK